MMLYIKRSIRPQISLLLCCFFLFFNSSIAFPEAQNESSQVCNPEFLLRTTLEDFRYIATFPLRMSKNDGLKLSALSVTTVGLVFYLDERIEEEYTGNEDSFPYVIGHKLAFLGKEYGRNSNRVFYMFGGLSASILTGGLLLEDKKLLKTTGLMTESFMFTLFTVGSLKMVLGRPRPYTEKGSTDFAFFSFSQDRALHSIPSAHTSSAFAMMTVIAKQYNYWWIKIPAYVFATGAAFQRVETRQHWMSDVLVGGVIGYSVASALIKNHTVSNNKKLSLKPFVSANKVGLLLIF